jgi:fatty acid synthase subunit beta, fungi type
LTNSPKIGAVLANWDKYEEPQINGVNGTNGITNGVNGTHA